MLGVMSQTRVFSENWTHDPCANRLAHYSLRYQGTLLLCKLVIEIVWFLTEVFLSCRCMRICHKPQRSLKRTELMLSVKFILLYVLHPWNIRHFRCAPPREIEADIYQMWSSTYSDTKRFIKLIKYFDAILHTLCLFNFKSRNRLTLCINLTVCENISYFFLDIILRNVCSILHPNAVWTGPHV